MTRLCSRTPTPGTWVSIAEDSGELCKADHKNKGANIPGKTREQLNWPGGFPLYYEETRKAMDNGWEGFTTEPPTAKA